MVAGLRRGWLRRLTIGLAASGLVLGASAVLAVVAATPSGADTLTFTTPGFTPFQVPAGVTSLTVTALGAGGETTTGRGPSGSGGSVMATIPVSACGTLEILVGGSASSNGLPLGGGGSGVWDATETFNLLIAGGGGVGGLNGSVSGVGGAGGDGGAGASFAVAPNPLGGPGQMGGDGTRGGGNGGFPGLGGGQNNGVDGNGVDGGQNGSGGNSGLGANGGGRGGGAGVGFSSGGGGGGGGSSTEGGGGGGGGSSFIESIALNPVFGTGAGPGENGSVTISDSGATGSCTPPPTTPPTTTPPAGLTSTGGSTHGPTLPFTGGPSMWVVVVGGFSVIGGGALLGLGRRRPLRERARHSR